jgi:hypothetical protein
MLGVARWISQRDAWNDSIGRGDFAAARCAAAATDAGRSAADESLGMQFISTNLDSSINPVAEDFGAAV